MVKLSSGNYLKADDITHNDSIKFLNEGEWVQNAKYTYQDGNPKMDFICQVEHDGKTKSFRLNKTNRDIMVKAYGDETKEWVGKSIGITTANALVSGKMMKVIMLVAEGAQEVWDA